MRSFLLCFLLVLPALACSGLYSAGGLYAQEDSWYRSNKSGLALEKIFSGLVALREEYALLVRGISVMETPESLRSYYDNSYSIEERILFEKGEEIRHQWIFRDQAGTSRVNASFSPEYFTALIEPVEEEDGDQAEKKEKSRSGFIEIYNEDRYITEEHIFAHDGSEFLVQFFYNDNLLMRSSTWKRDNLPEDPEGEFVLQITDNYRYTRSNSLRAVERVYHAAVSEDNNHLRIAFPALNSSLASEIGFDRPHILYNSGSVDSFEILEGDRITYITDSRGRVLREVRRDEEENILGEVENTWSGDRLKSIRITSGGEERFIEFEYDSQGNRIIEMNYTNGILERIVRSQDKRDIEELYINGVLILRAIWENGKKISEERVRSLQEGGR